MLDTAQTTMQSTLNAAYAAFDVGKIYLDSTKGILAFVFEFYLFLLYFDLFVLYCHHRYCCQHCR